jgi:hypothetical protein
MWAYAVDAGRLAIAVTLLIAGASKLVSPRLPAASLGEVYGWTRPVGTGAVRTVAAIELVAATLVASGWALTAGLALTALVGTAIVAFTLTAMRRGVDSPCGCFGESGDRPIGARNLLAGAGLLAGAAGLALLPGTVAAPAALGLPLTAVIALAVVMVRDRARLLAPFQRHFGPVPAGPVPAGPEVPND